MPSIRIPAGTPYLVRGTTRYGRVFETTTTEGEPRPDENAYHITYQGQKVSVPAPACQVLPEQEKAPA